MTFPMETLERFTELFEAGMPKIHACDAVGVKRTNIKALLGACLTEGLIFFQCDCNNRATRMVHGEYVCERCYQVDFGDIHFRRIVTTRTNSWQPKPTPVPSLTGYHVHLFGSSL
jgi:hypothetical protein